MSKSVLASDPNILTPVNPALAPEHSKPKVDQGTKAKQDEAATITKRYEKWPEFVNKFKDAAKKSKAKKKKDDKKPEDKDQPAQPQPAKVAIVGMIPELERFTLIGY